MMKSAYVIAAVGAFVVGSVQAQCECDPADSACLNECVAITQNCISECHNNECYNRCIAYHWPGVDPKTQSNVWEQPTSTWQMGSTSNSLGPTSAAWVPFSAPTAGQSSQWTHTHGWTSPATARASGALPSASASPSTSGSLSTLQMSKGILGVTLAAAYMLQ